MHAKYSNYVPKIRIKFNSIETQKLIEIIKPYIREELLYKINENSYIDYINDYHKNKKQ
jgi:hypothetical protein